MSGEKVLEIRNADEVDFDAIVQLNAAEEQKTSAMNRERLAQLHVMASYHKVAVVDGKVAGFLLAMGATAPYRNDNFEWFAARYASFIYIDRIVVSQEFAGKKIGSSLYVDLFNYARSKGVTNVVCEYNIEPPNPASKAFHDRFGFQEVGSQRVANGTKLVSLQAAGTTPIDG